MSLEQIKKSISTAKYFKEENILKEIKRIVLDVTSVEVSVKLPRNNKLVLVVNNSSAASEINLHQQELLNNLNVYLNSINQELIKKITIKQS